MSVSLVYDVFSVKVKFNIDLPLLSSCVYQNKNYHAYESILKALSVYSFKTFYFSGDVPYYDPQR